MRVLFISPFLPGPNVDHAGGRDVYHLMRSLSERHSISLLCPATPDELTRWAGDVRGFCEHVEIAPPRRGFFSAVRRPLDYIRWPRSVGMSYSPDLHARLNCLLHNHAFDLVQYENVQMLPYSEGVDLPGILDCIDISFVPMFLSYLSGKGSLPRRLYWMTEWPRLQAYESRALRRFKGIVVRSERDAVVARMLNPEATVTVAQVWPLTAGCETDTSRPHPQHCASKPVVLFVGAMWRPVNIEACMYFLDQIWPAIRQEVPAAEFWIVGSSPPPNLTKRNGRDNVVVTGYVDDLLPHYLRCALVVAPLLAAGGVINKVADAMHVGIPVVSTSTANQGIGAMPGRDILIADDAPQFAANVVALLQKEELYQRISTNSQRYIKAQFDWEGSIRGIESLYQSTVAACHAS